jgi:predicted glycoside hydrolase/deacetylase ChbG (UPF0249 family)
MSIPSLIIVNADDIGLKPSINKAILYCFEKGYINSTSLLTNMDCFDETVDLIHQNPVITNIGAHINFAEGKPVTDFKHQQFLNSDGSWNIDKTRSSLRLLNKETCASFLNEINAQIEKALKADIKINHLDSHLHLHTLPAFHNLFIEVAKTRRLKLRLAQTYRENSYIKFFYRKLINNQIIKNSINYTDLFETVDVFLPKKDRALNGKTVEVMVHPDFDATGELIDHLGP